MSAVWQTISRRTRSQHPAARQTLLDRSLSDLDHARGQMLVLGCMTAPEKVATLLLELWRKSAKSSFQPLPRKSNLPTIALSMTREDMADYLGLTLETVSRCLSQFTRQGIHSADKCSNN